jgi:SET and MYND domain-containing protein
MHVFKKKLFQKIVYRDAPNAAPSCRKRMKSSTPCVSGSRRLTRPRRSNSPVNLPPPCIPLASHTNAAPDPAKAHQLTSKLIPILASAGLAPSAHPLLALTRLYTALLITKLANTPTQTALDEAVIAATKVSAGLGEVLRHGHPVRGIARAELGKLLAVDEPEPRAPGTAAEEALRYPPSGVKRLRLALETLVHARAELSVGFGAANEGGLVGRGVREDIVKLERELGAWKKGVGEALKDAREAGALRRA